MHQEVDPRGAEPLNIVKEHCVGQVQENIFAVTRERIGVLGSISCRIRPSSNQRTYSAPVIGFCLNALPKLRSLILSHTNLLIVRHAFCFLLKNLLSRLGAWIKLPMVWVIDECFHCHCLN